jgi:signal transduction histidine kinase/CheY-like chemotaxis protein
MPNFRSMRLQTKIALAVLPLVVASIFAVGFGAMNVAHRVLRTSTFDHMHVVLNIFVRDHIEPLHGLLAQYGLSEAAPFVADYQRQAANAAENFEVAPTGHLFALDGDGALAFCNCGMSSEPPEPVLGIVARSSEAIFENGAKAGEIPDSAYRRFYVARRFSPWNWTVFYAVSDREFETLFHSIRKETLATAAAAGAGVVLLLVLVLRTIFVRPVSVLRAAASDIAGGKDVQSIPVRSGDELGALARHMEILSMGVRANRRMEAAWRHELEAEVERRTRALQAANASLTEEIAERNRAEARLRRSEDRYRLLFDTILHGFLLVEVRDGEASDAPAYRILEANPAFRAMRGRADEEWAGRSLEDAFPDMNAAWRERLAGVANSGESIRFESHVSSLDRHLDIVAFRPRKNRIALLFSDLTPGKRLEARLRQAQKMESIGTLAGGIAHDFNNILFPIIGYAEMAREEMADRPGPRAYIDEIVRASERARNLVSQILTFGRQTEEEVRPLRIQSILKEALHLLRASIPASIEIRRHIDARCGAVMGDPSQIHQIAMNLCTNAYHAMQPDGGLLGIRLEETNIGAADPDAPPDLAPGRYARLIVSDTGTGIPPGDLERIFEPYFTTKEQGKGTGLGLAVVHGIVKRNGGTVAVRSELGRGTAFHVYFPLISEGNETTTPEDQPPPPGSERILVVDDEAPITGMLEQMLTRLGYAVTVRTASPEALELFREDPNRFDLVLTDMTMPGMSGIQLARALLEIRPDLPILLCTGFSEIVSEQEARAAGIRAYLMKPVVRSQLARAIRAALAGESENVLSRSE